MIMMLAIGVGGLVLVLSGVDGIIAGGGGGGGKLLLLILILVLS